MIPKNIYNQTSIPNNNCLLSINGHILEKHHWDIVIFKNYVFSFFFFQIGSFLVIYHIHFIVTTKLLMEKTNHRLLKSPQRSSKISMALKNSFISTILEEGMSIKKVIIFLIRRPQPNTGSTTLQQRSSIKGIERKK